jgi:hypothetical protein
VRSHYPHAFATTHAQPPSRLHTEHYTPLYVYNHSSTTVIASAHPAAATRTRSQPHTHNLHPVCIPNTIHPFTFTITRARLSSHQHIQQQPHVHVHNHTHTTSIPFAYRTPYPPLRLQSLEHDCHCISTSNSRNTHTFRTVYRSYFSITPIAPPFFHLLLSVLLLFLSILPFFHDRSQISQSNGHFSSLLAKKTKHITTTKYISLSPKIT